MHQICFDIGGTQFRFALIGPNGVLFQHKEHSRKGVSELRKQIRDALSVLKERTSPEIQINGISIGCPGPVSGTSMSASKPLEIFEPLDFAKEIAEFSSLPVQVANDLNLAVRAERKHGKGRGLRNFAVVTLSTGVGVGAVVGDRVVESRIELGHSVVETDERLARECIGHKGCWNIQAGGIGLPGGADEFFRKSDPAELKRLRTYNARGLAHVIHAFDPEKIILMGSLAVHQFEKIIPTPNEIAEHAFLKPVPPIEVSKLGDEIGLLGAYELAAQARK